MVTAIISSLPCSVYREFSSFLPREETLIHGPKQEHPAPKGLMNHLSFTLGCSSSSSEGPYDLFHSGLVVAHSREYHRENISWETD